MPGSTPVPGYPGSMPGSTPLVDEESGGARAGSPSPSVPVHSPSQLQQVLAIFVAATALPADLAGRLAGLLPDVAPPPRHHRPPDPVRPRGRGAGLPVGVWRKAGFFGSCVPCVLLSGIAIQNRPSPHMGVRGLGPCDCEWGGGGRCPRPFWERPGGFGCGGTGTGASLHSSGDARRSLHDAVGRDASESVESPVRGGFYPPPPLPFRLLFKVGDPPLGGGGSG